jgi:hypothetical protein
MRGGRRTPAGGRPVTSENLRRIKCDMIRLPRWLLVWLKAQSESDGRIIEKALIERYRLEAPKEGEKIIDHKS